MLDVHVRGPLFLIQAVARDLIRRGASGAVVNMTSIRAIVAEPGQLHYCAAKGALHALAPALAPELWGGTTCGSTTSRRAWLPPA